MENWLSIEGLEGGTRNNFLINKKPTEMQIYRIKGLSKEIRAIATNIETSLTELRRSEPQSAAEDEVEQQIVDLSLIHESLNEIIAENKALYEQFVFEIRRAEAGVENTLEKLRRYPRKKTAVPKGLEG